MLNPLTMMKLNQAKNKFLSISNHPKFASFFRAYFQER